MKETFPEMIYATIDKLAHQENARTTLHALLCAIKKTTGCDAACFAVKDRKTDTLKIINQIDLSETVRRGYSRGIGSGVIGRVFFESETLVVRRSEDPAGYKEMLLDRAYAEVFVGRIADAGRAYGFLAVYFTEGGTCTDAVKQFLAAAAQLAALALEKERNLELLDELRQVNPETGLLVYHHFHNLLHAEYSKSARYRQPLSLALVDIDNYKDTMRRLGPACGLALCREVIAELRACTRGIDHIAHFGIDEFIISLPNTDGKGSETVLRRFRERLTGRKFTDCAVATSVSIGLTTRQEGQSFDTFLRNCQVALADAKRAGKGQLLSR